ncbi:helix-turn-helix transcriptional regulator [Paenibacillus sp. SI8]|uniref:helix-turn-helix transcriptional regulator n=1 Tax=unclassified Paenibacillus TaxID=185978 RepID=UPI0034658F65
MSEKLDYQKKFKDIIQNKFAVLTPREVEITSYWVMDFDTKKIAEELMISEHTVRTYIKKINYKLGVNSKASLILSILISYISLIDI